MNSPYVLYVVIVSLYLFNRDDEFKITYTGKNIIISSCRKKCEKIPNLEIFFYKNTHNF